MMEAINWPRAAALHGLSIPLLFALGYLLTPRSTALRHAARVASLAAVLAGFATAVAWVPNVFGIGVPIHGAAVSFGVRLDVVTFAMLVLVCCLGAVIARYSQAYLDGDPKALTFSRTLLAALGCVTTLVVANNLLVVAVGWLCTSLALHRLLTLYPDRPAALLAAHKKFLVSRAADLLFMAALVLMASSVRSLALDDIALEITARKVAPWVLEVTGLLLATAVVLKSAQIPFHGWLIQVMEAPTPVSALLHAGVVNIGGFILIRLSSVMVHAHSARLLLVVMGTTTAVVASVVAMTRVSVKVALAWSTCAQMGFMLVQCGLGLWHLALLHLIAHSLYKAHAFLNAGGTVDAYRARARLTARTSASWSDSALGGVISFAAVVVSATVMVRVMNPEVSDLSLAPLSVILVLSLTPMAVQCVRVGRGGVWQAGWRCIGVSLLYFALHEISQYALPLANRAPFTWTLWSIVLAGMACLFVVQMMAQLSSRVLIGTRLHAWLFAGLYADDLLTRVVLRVWPPRPPLEMQRRDLPPVAITPEA